MAKERRFYQGSLVVKDRANLDAIRRGIADLAAREVLVGFPEDTAARDELGVDGISNAALGYIHDNGMPERNIPQREFMRPGIDSVLEKVADKLGAGARALVRTANPDVIDSTYHQVGLMAATAIKKKITEGIPPPLADETLRRRAASVKGGRLAEVLELTSREHGRAPSMDFAKPLIDTGAMLAAVTYVIRDRKDRK